MVDAMQLLAACTGFQWDEGNAQKNWLKHGVSQGECEEVFFRPPLLVMADEAHSKSETRYYALGQTEAGRGLFLVFAIRGDLIRIVSARDISRDERKEYRRAQASEAPPNP
jgi:uncharacterized DUF497 family protein